MDNQSLIEKYTELIANGFNIDRYGIQGCGPKIDGPIIYKADIAKWIEDNTPKDNTEINLQSDKPLYCNSLPLSANERIYNQSTDVRILYPKETEDLVQIVRDGCIVTIVINPIVIGGNGNLDIKIKDPINISKEEDSDILFSVPLSGSITSYKWYLDGELIDQTNSVLYISDLQESDSGTYSLEISDGTNTVKKDVLVLTVDIPCIEPVITVQPQNKTIIEGSNVSFTVVATGTDLTYQWYNGVNPITRAISNIYTINSVTLANNNSLITVKVTGKCGEVTSSVATLLVNPACDVPVITNQPSSQTVNQGSDITLTVSATGTNIQYQWYRDGILLDNETNNSLVLSNIQELHNYYVKITGDCGEVTSNAVTVTVLVPFEYSWNYDTTPTDYDSLTYETVWMNPTDNSVTIPSVLINNGYLVARYPLYYNNHFIEDYTTWYNNIFNSGTVPDQSFQDISIISDHKYILSRNQDFGTDSTGPTITFSK